MKTPKGLKYAKTDEWVSVEGDEATLGISDFAQDQLSDVVYVELMVEEGDTVSKGDTLATVESVKAAADVNDTPNTC
jgi:glycine cleavage system H protein